MLSITKLKKRLKNKNEYKLIKKSNKDGNNVSFLASMNESTVLNGNNEIGAASINNSFIGRHTYIGSGKLDKCCIGNFCSISADVCVVTGSHPIEFVSTFPGFYKSNKKRFPGGSFEFTEEIEIENKFSCLIGNDVWIGRSVLIKGGVKIGDGAIIGMGSVVTKDVPPYAIVAGNPAKIIRFRFDEKTINSLLKIKWWNWDDKKISLEKDSFINIDSFINKHLK